MIGRIKVDIHENHRQYPIFIGSHSGEKIADRVSEIYNGDKILIVTDENVRELYGDIIVTSLKNKGFNIVIYSITPGEESKSYHSLRKGHDILIKNNFNRDSLIIALGGGVVGDLAGFLAATYLRGIPIVQIPTTLLAQVDSSVGGKTAINHPEGKNLIGAFHQPLTVIIDPDFLKTLPERELKTGLAEVIKHGLIEDYEMTKFLLEKHKDIFDFNIKALTYIIENSCRIKAAVVTEDEKEKGKRAILNYGHTIGHALEAVTGYKKYTHGEAVAIGMVGAARLSYRLGYLSREELAMVEEIIDLYGLPLKYQYREDTEEIFKRLFYDKKVRNKRVRWILLDGIGRAIIEDGIEHSLVKEVLEGLA